MQVTLDTPARVTTTEAAELCGLSVGAFRQWRRRNPALLRPLERERAPRFCLAEVQAMLGFRSDEAWSRLKRAR